MKTIQFYKYQGTGNDFVMIDNRTDFFSKKDTALIRFLCDRRFGIGGDGLILLENDESVDFKMVYYNADGNESTMCGNGGRCIVAFAYNLGLIKKDTLFNAVDGLHRAEVKEDNVVALQMIDVVKQEILKHTDFTFLFTGSPHHVALVNSLQMFDVYGNGKSIRYSNLYEPEGTNVNFVEQLADNHFKIRTYERGVENETLSCGTGATAVAVAMNSLGLANNNEVLIDVEGGNLKITFDQNNEKYFNVMLVGVAKLVFKGEITV